MLLTALLLIQLIGFFITSQLKNKPHGLLFCGLFGFSGAHPVDITKLRWLAVENKSRGMHSTGVFITKKNKSKEEHLLKDTFSANVFINQLDFTTLVPGSYTVQGHTRAATVGSVTKENAHPFEFKKETDSGARVVGAHNGFVLKKIDGDFQTKKFGFNIEEFPVDSMLIFALLAKDGNYDRLSQLEGAIACTFQFPDNYPSDLFLYRASGRELHMGLAPEGIYYSSERGPLDYIGCKNIVSLPENNIVILRNGDILDQQPLSKPRIKMSLSAKRDNWHSGLTASELKTLGLEELSTNNSSGYYNRVGPKMQTKQLTIGDDSANTTTDSLKDSHKFRDQLGLVVADVKRLVEGLVDSPQQFSIVNSYTNTDTDACLVLITLRSSTPKHPALAGWTVWDKDKETIAGITALNGVTVLRFTKEQCCNDHTLMLAHPIEPDNKAYFSITLKPEQSSVMEVTLDLPFPQTNQGETCDNSEDKHGNSDTPTSGLGEHLLHICSTGLKQCGSILPIDKQNSTGVQESVQSLYKRPEEKQVPGTKGLEVRGGENALGTEEVHKGKYLGSNEATGIIIPLMNRASIKSVISTENSKFALKSQVKAVLGSQEYSRSYKLWNDLVGYVLNLRKLFHDAAVLKLYHISLHNTSYALPYYAHILCRHFFDDYKEKEITEDETMEVYKLIGQLSAISRVEKKGSSEVSQKIKK